jgi:hypothetical protein
VAAIIASALTALAACGGSSSTPSAPSIPKVSITAGANGYDLQAATPLPAGLIEFDLRNNDRAPHQFTFASPLVNTTLAELRATVTSGKLDQLPKEVELGFGWGLPPMAAQTLYLTYQASTNFVLSLISAGPHTPVQAAQGYLAQFTVRGATQKGQTQPHVAGTLTFNAHSVSVPTGFGKGTFAMINTDPTGHRLSFYRFTGDAKPLAAVVATFAAQGELTGPTPPPGPPPEVALGLRLLGGADQFPAFGCSCIMGSRVLGAFALAPGTYVALGDGFDPKTNVLEATEGLAAEFTVH